MSQPVDLRIHKVLLIRLVLSMLPLVAGCSEATRQPLPSATGQSSLKASELVTPPSAVAIQFQDMRLESGIGFPLSLPSHGEVGIKETIGHGAALIDFDGDGLLDVLLTGPNRVALFRNQGDWKFGQVHDAGFRQSGYWQGVAVGDLNADSRPDIFLSGFGCSALYVSDSSGGYRDATAQAGLDTIAADRWQTTAAFADVDRDGRLDLYVAGYVDLGGKSGACTYPGGIVTACSPLRFKPQPGTLYKNLGDGRFEDATNEFQLTQAHGNSLSAVFADPNRDGYPDLYIANDQLPCDLFVNEQGRKFDNWGVTSGTAFALGGAVQAGMGADFGDYDNDGREDLVVTNYFREPMSLYRNTGELVYFNVSDSARLASPTMKTAGWGVKWVDLDNDGWLDLAVANGHPLHRINELERSTTARQKFQVFHNRRNGGFDEMETLGDQLPRSIAGRGLSVGDVDNDGRVDLLISDIEGQPLLLRNVTSDQNHWLCVRLSGKTVTEGSLVTVQAGSRKWIRRSTTGGSYMSASDSRVHFGLGTLTRIEQLSVSWPDGTTTVHAPPSVDRAMDISYPGVVAHPSSESLP